MKNIFRKVSILVLSGLFVTAAFDLSSAQNPPASQQMSGELRSRQMQEQEERLRKAVERPRAKKEVEEEPAEETGAPAQDMKKAFIKTINVSGVTLFSAGQIRDIVSPYENKELTLREMQKVAGLITDLYRREGYIT
ncbi:MAG: POTRA domain-containing protein, partial [Candidatus Omnitrophota bacterium]